MAPAVQQKTEGIRYNSSGSAYSKGHDRAKKNAREERESEFSSSWAVKVLDLISHAEEFLRWNTDAVFVNLKVEVITAGVAGEANISDELALLDPVAGLNGQAGAVSIKGGITGIVVDGDVISPAVTPLVLVVGHDYGAGGGSIDRCAVVGGHIKALVAGVTLPAGRNIAVTRAWPLEVDAGS